MQSTFPGTSELTSCSLGVWVSRLLRTAVTANSIGAGKGHVHEFWNLNTDTTASAEFSALHALPSPCARALNSRKKKAGESSSGRERDCPRKPIREMKGRGPGSFGWYRAINARFVRPWSDVQNLYSKASIAKHAL